MDRRLSRRSPRLRLALSIGALVLAVPGVSACGFNYATDRENTIANGTNNQDGVVDVLNAVIVSERGRLRHVHRDACPTTRPTRPSASSR